MRAISCSSNCPAVSVGTPSCRNTIGTPVRFMIQNGADIDIYEK